MTRLSYSPGATEALRQHLNWTPQSLALWSVSDAGWWATAHRWLAEGANPQVLVASSALHAKTPPSAWREGEGIPFLEVLAEARVPMTPAHWQPFLDAGMTPTRQVQLLDRALQFGSFAVALGLMQQGIQAGWSPERPHTTQALRWVLEFCRLEHSAQVLAALLADGHAQARIQAVMGSHISPWHVLDQAHYRTQGAAVARVFQTPDFLGQRAYYADFLTILRQFASLPSADRLNGVGDTAVHVALDGDSDALACALLAEGVGREAPAGTESYVWTAARLDAPHTLSHLLTHNITYPMHNETGNTLEQLMRQVNAQAALAVWSAHHLTQGLSEEEALPSPPRARPRL